MYEVIGGVSYVGVVSYGGGDEVDRLVYWWDEFVVGCCGVKRKVVRVDKLASDDEWMDGGKVLVLCCFEEEILVTSQGCEPFFQAECKAEAVCFFFCAGEE